MGFLDSLMNDATNAAKQAASKVSDGFYKAVGEYSSTAGLGNTEFNSGMGQYQISQLTYPSNLFASDSQYGGNYVVFYINVAEDSKLIPTDVSNVVGIDLNERLRSTLTEAGLSTKTLIGTSAAMGGLAGTVIGSMFGATGSGGVVGVATGGAAAGIVSAVTGGKLRAQQKRLKSAIALNVPNSLNIRYSANWDPIETAGFQGVGAVLSAGGAKAAEEAQRGNYSSISNAIKSAAGGTWETGKSAAGAAVTPLTNAALNAPGVGGVLSAATGLTPNPKKEQVFGGVDFRTFTFEYQFSPRNAEESRNVLNIIQMFKLHMHPEFKDEASYLFIYPSEFDIHYYYYTKDNKSIHKHTSCVLSDMSINYTPNGNFNTFEDGTPTQIDVQLTFKELAILTKTQIAAGY